MMIQKHVKQLYNAYGYTDIQLLPAQKGYRNESHPCITMNGEKLNLIVYKNEPEILTKIKNANSVSSYLARLGFLVRHSIDQKILQIHVKSTVRYVALYNFVPGQTIAWEMYSMEHIKNLGKAMSDMHAALKDFPAHKLPMVCDEYIELTNQMQEYFATEGVIKALKSKLHIHLPVGIFTDAYTLLNIANSFPHQQALHMDFVRGNILFNGKQVCGILDFEKVSLGHPVFDIARTLAFLLVDCKFKSEEKVMKYFLQSGYNKRGMAHFTRLTYHKTDVLNKLIDLFLLYDFYKFLLHNPYESLQDNEHFVLTCKLLQSRAIITVIK